MFGQTKVYNLFFSAVDLIFVSPRFNIRGGISPLINAYMLVLAFLYPEGHYWLLI